MLTHTSTGDAQTQFCLSLCGVAGSWCTQGLFEPSEHLWQKWGLILNINSPLLTSYWGFFFALGCGVISSQLLQRLSSYWGFSDLGHGVSPHDRSSEAQPPLLALNIEYLLTAAPGPIPSWQINGEAVETVTDFILGGSKITADGDCSHEIKRCSLLRRKVMTNLDSILKSRDITLPTKAHIVKAMVLPVVMHGCELDHKEGGELKN